MLQSAQHLVEFPGLLTCSVTMSYNLRSHRNSKMDNSDVSISIEHENTFDPSFHTEFTNIRETLASLSTKMENSSGTSMFCPPTFSGLPEEDAVMWLERFVSWINFNNWKDPTKIYNALKLRLCGTALDWCNNLSGSLKTNPEVLYRSFKEHFQNIHPKWLLEQKLFERKMQEGEDLEDFITEIDRLCNHLGKSEKDKVITFIRGLTPRIRMFVIQKNPQTWQETIQCSRLSSASLTDACGPVLSTPRESMEINSVIQCLKTQNEAISRLSDTVEMMSVAKKETAVRAAQSDVNVIKCQICERIGHSARFCFKYKNKNSPMRCYNCGKTGHKKSACKVTPKN